MTLEISQKILRTSICSLWREVRCCARIWLRTFFWLIVKCGSARAQFGAFKCAKQRGWHCHPAHFHTSLVAKANRR